MKTPFHLATPTDLEIVVTRDFDAPRDAVWRTMTDPAMVRRWLYGPPGWEMTVCEDDLKVGGGFRWEWRGPEGAVMSMYGSYREFSPPAKAVRNEVFQMGGDAPIGEQLATLELADQGGRTALIVTLRYDSQAARDGALASGMEHGMAASYDRLEQMLLASSP